MKKILLIILINLMCLNVVSAYENNLFKIDIPNNYSFENNKNVYKWINNDNEKENIVITVTNVKNNKNILDYTEEDISNYEKYIEDEINNNISEYDFKVIVNNGKKDIINNNNCITYDIYWDTSKTLGYNIYQKSYVFTNKNYLYTYTFTSNSDIANNEENIKIINTFSTINKSINYKYILYFSLIIGITFAILKQFKKHKSNK